MRHHTAKERVPRTVRGHDTERLGLAARAGLGFGRFSCCSFRHHKQSTETAERIRLLAARGRSRDGRVVVAIGPDARRRDAGDAMRSSRSGNAADGPIPPATRRATRGYSTPSMRRPCVVKCFFVGARPIRESSPGFHSHSCWPLRDTVQADVRPDAVLQTAFLGVARQTVERQFSDALLGVLRSRRGRGERLSKGWLMMDIRDGGVLVLWG